MRWCTKRCRVWWATHDNTILQRKAAICMSVDMQIALHNTHTHNIQYLLLAHGYANALQRYVLRTRTLPLFFYQASNHMPYTKCGSHYLRIIGDN